MAITSAEIAARTAGLTVSGAFVKTVAAAGERVALRWRVDASGGHDPTGEAWAEWTWSDWAERSARLAGALGELGVGPGTRVVLMLRNRPEFHVADVAVLLTGATPISIYNSSSPEQIAYLVRHCEASVAIVEDEELLGRLLQVRPELPDLAHVVVVEPPAAAPSGVLAWSALCVASPVDLESAAHIAGPDDLVTVIYTSGTTGAPKGVMLDHTNVCWANESLRVALDHPTEG